MSGMIYFIRAGKKGPIKIGFAKDVSERLAALQTSHFEELVVLRSFPGDRKAERLLHRRFSSFHVRGEWFDLPERILKEIPSSFLVTRRSRGRPFRSGPVSLRSERDAMRRTKLVVLLWRRGLSTRDIGEIVGCSGSHVSRIANDAGEQPRGNPTLADFFVRGGINEIGDITKKLLTRAEAASALVDEGHTRDEVCRLLHLRRADLELMAVYAGFEVPGGDCEGLDETGQVKLRSCSLCRSQFEASRYRFRCDPCLAKSEGETEYLSELPA